MGMAYKFRHQHISWIKSVIRLAGYGYLWHFTAAGAFLLILSEIVGIAEEIGHE